MKFKGNSFFFFEDQGDYTNFVDVIPNVLRFSVRCAEKSLNRKFSVEVLFSLRPVLSYFKILIVLFLLFWLTHFYFVLFFL